MLEVKLLQVTYWSIASGWECVCVAMATVVGDPFDSVGTSLVLVYTEGFI